MPATASAFLLAGLLCDWPVEHCYRPAYSGKGCSAMSIVLSNIRTHTTCTHMHRHQRRARARVHTPRQTHTVTVQQCKQKNRFSTMHETLEGECCSHDVLREDEIESLSQWQLQQILATVNYIYPCQRCHTPCQKTTSTHLTMFLWSNVFWNWISRFRFSMSRACISSRRCCLTA